MQILIDLPGLVTFIHKGCSLAYNPTTGECYRQNVRGEWKQITPGKTSQGYTKTTIGGTAYKLHRLIAQYFLNGGLELTSKEIVDHIEHADGTAWQDRLSNLRITTVRGNQQNRSTAETSKFTGVVYVERAGRKPWRACCQIAGKSKYIGYYASELEAAAAYINYLQVLGLDARIAEQNFWRATVCKS